MDECQNCGKRELVMPLHLERGGPLFCIGCGIDWHGKHGRRRNAGRIVIKALKAYFAAGGLSRDINKLSLAASDISFPEISLAYEGDKIGVELPDLTSELLNDLFQLVHPDHQPPERRELATRVTQELTRLKPFVFPAPKPEPPPVYKPEPRDASLEVPREHLKKPSRCYPCEDCADHIPFYYCAPCKAEHDRRINAELERERAKRRRWYQRRKAKREWLKPPLTCICGVKFKPKRADMKYCSPACKQKAYRQRTPKNIETIIPAQVAMSCRRTSTLP